MSELKKVIIVSAEKDTEKGVSLQLQVAELDYSAIYDATVYFKSFDKDTKAWSEFDDSEKGKQGLERIEVAKTVLGSFDPEELESKEVELWVDEENGKAYFEEGKGFIKVEKPKVGLKGLKRVPIIAIKDSDKGRQVIIQHKGINYGFNYNYGVWVDKVEKFVLNKAQRAKKKSLFNEDFEDVGLTWETAPDAIEKAFDNGTPFVVDCEVQVNQLDTSSPYGWIKGSALYDGDNTKAMRYIDSLPNEDNEEQRIDIPDDDLPF